MVYTVQMSTHQQQDLQGAKLKHVHLQIIIDLNVRTHTHKPLYVLRTQASGRQA